MPSLVASLAWSTRDVVGSDGQFDHTEPTDITVRDGVPLSIARELLVRLDMLCQPVTGDEVQRLAHAITRLRAKTTTRANSDQSVEMQAIVYTEELERYPIGAVEDACAEWPNISKWWPTWNELLRMVERYSTPRRHIADTLRRFVERER